MTNGLVVFIGTFMSNVGAYAYYVVLGRTLNAERYSELLALTTIVLIATVPANVIATSAARLMSELAAVGSAGKVASLVRWLSGVALKFGVAFVCIALIFNHLATRFFGITDGGAVIATGFAAASSFTGPVMRSALQGQQRFTGFSISLGLEGLARPLGGVLFAIILPFGIVGALSGLGLAAAFGAALAMLLLMSQLIAPRNESFPKVALIASTWRISIALVSLTSLMSIDVVFARHYFDAEVSGGYGAAAIVARAFFSALSFVPIILLPKTAYLHALGKSTSSVITRSFQVITATAVPIILVTCVFSRQIINIFAGSQFSVGAHYLVAYLVAMVFATFANTIALYLIAHNEFKFASWLPVMAAGEVFSMICWHRSPFDLLASTLVFNVATAALLIFASRAVGIKATACDAF